MLLFLKAYWNLIHFDLYLMRDDFASLYKSVRKCQVRNHSTESVERICTAVNFACIWYWKEVLCLQRSAATTCLARKNGIPAELVIGAQQMPFMAHAWVELNGNVINDRPYVREMYATMDRC